MSTEEQAPVVQAEAIEVAAAPAETTDNTALKAAILKQVEFYFSDSNLPTDAFMTELTSKNNGYVSIAKIASFKRMREYKDIDLIVEAIRGSPELLEVSEDGKEVRRKAPLGSNKDHFQRSIYAKGFGEETPTLQLELEQFFGALGDAKSVRLRRENTKAKTFKGSVFVEYATLAEALKIADQKLEYNGNELLVMTKEAYCEMKAKELGLDPADIVRSSKGFSGSSDKKRPRVEEKEEEIVETVEDLKNKVLKFSGISSSDSHGMKAFKGAMKEFCNFGYIHWPKETTELVLQVNDKDAAELLASLLDAGFEFGGQKPEMAVASDEEVQSFLDSKKEWKAAMSTRDSENGGRGHRGGRGGRGGRGRGRGGRGGHRDGARKQIRTD